MGATACPFCDEAIAQDAAKCPHCGEQLVGAEPPPLQDRPFTLGIGIAIGLSVTVVASVFVAGAVAVQRVKRGAGKTKCSNNLRQLGLAALQYSDDKRFFPHVRAITQLDGDVTTSDTPAKIRNMMWLAYFDDPEGLICPYSRDQAVAPPGGFYGPSAWFWGGKNAGPSSAPKVPGPDPALDQTKELSYGWTRKGLMLSTRSDTLLAADRAVIDPQSDRGDVLYGNHEDGWNALQADAAVDFLSTKQDPYPGAILIGTESRREGFLSIKPQLDPSVFPR